MNITVTNLIGIFTLEKDKIKLLLKDNELISIKCDDDIDIVNKKYVEKNLKIKEINLKQCYTFSKKENNDLDIHILYIDIVPLEKLKLNNGFSLIPISDIDKLDKYKNKALEYLKKELVINKNIIKLYPQEFSLPKLQKLYEDLLNEKYDRRNFRKRLLKLDIIESLDKISSNSCGRPAKLYKFKEIKEERSLI